MKRPSLWAYPLILAHPAIAYAVACAFGIQDQPFVAYVVFGITGTGLGYVSALRDALPKETK